jgi:hypothetical protein
MNDKAEETKQERPRKLYQSPTLIVYGDIGKITQGGKSSTMSDAGKNFMS